MTSLRVFLLLLYGTITQSVQYCFERPPTRCVGVFHEEFTIKKTCVCVCVSVSAVFIFAPLGFAFFIGKHRTFYRFVK